MIYKVFMGDIRCFEVNFKLITLLAYDTESKILIVYFMLDGFVDLILNLSPLFNDWESL